MSYKLEYPYTEEQQNNFIVEHNHIQGLRIETIDNIVEVEVKTETEDGEVTEIQEMNMPTYFALEAWEKLVDGEVIDNTEEWEEEQAKKEAERIGNLECTKRVFILMLEELGINYFNTIKPLIESNPQAQLEWELCVQLQRKNPLLDIMGGQLGVTSEQLDNLFKFANGEITLEDFKGSTSVEASESNSGVEADGE